MKKPFILMMALLLLCACGSNEQERSTNTLKVYNWSNYIGEGVIDDFKVWYKDQTGEEIDVIYQTFDINEAMLSKIEKGKEDWDVVCPSDYIIERMLNNGLLLPLDFTAIPDSINYIRNNQSPYIREMFRNINPDIDANDYSVAFMWGTTGILYNAKYVTDEEASTWDVIRNKKFDQKIFMKDAYRDVFGPVLIHIRQKELQEGTTTLDKLMRSSSKEDIAAVESFLDEVRPLVAGWEADFGKEEMTKERGWVSLNWSGDAVWAIEEAAEVGVELKYVVPKEGSNVWFDGWVIPKYAKNIKAATLFIDFMCRPDIAIRNMEETGYVSANGDISVLESQVDDSLEPIDISYFFPGATSVSVDPVLYPDYSTIRNCALMHDSGDDTDSMVTMFSKIKGEKSNTLTVIVIASAAAAVIVTVFSIHKRMKRKRNGRKPGKPSRR